MRDMIKTILVTGAAGFIGRNLCQQLLGNGYRVKALLRSSEQATMLPSELEHITGDLSDISGLLEACKGIDVVVHLAGVAHVNNMAKKMLQEVNVEGTRRLLQAAIDNRVTRFVFISSSLACVAEEQNTYSNGYGQSKLGAEQLVRSAGERRVIETVVLRPVNVYGPGMKGNIAAMVSLISRGRLPPLPSLDPHLSLVSVEDLACAILLASEACEANGKTYLVTDGLDYSIKDMEQAIYAAVGKRVPAWRTPHVVLYSAASIAGWAAKIRSFFGPGKGLISGISGKTYKKLVADNLFSNGQICKELGFKPTTTFYESLPRILKFGARNTR